MIEMRLTATSAVLAAVLSLIWTASLPAQTDMADHVEFRVENKVFLENEREPHSESTTVFFRGIVYDYLKEPAEVTVFDKAHGRFVLLNPARRVYTEVSMEKVAAFADALRRWTAVQPDPFVQFLGDPKFEEEFDEENHQLVFNSPWMTYRLATISSESEAMSRQYHEFCDWYCRLNTLLTPGARPPFARMVVNASLETRRLFPNETHLTIRPKKGVTGKRPVIRSEHQLIRRLVESDRDRAAQSDQFIAMFKQLSFEEYQENMKLNR